MATAALAIILLAVARLCRVCRGGEEGVGGQRSSMVPHQEHLGGTVATRQEVAGAPPPPFSPPPAGEDAEIGLEFEGQEEVAPGAGKSSSQEETNFSRLHGPPTPGSPGGAPVTTRRSFVLRPPPQDSYLSTPEPARVVRMSSEAIRRNRSRVGDGDDPVAKYGSTAIPKNDASVALSLAGGTNV